MESIRILSISQRFIQVLLPTLLVHLRPQFGCSLAALPNFLHNPLLCALDLLATFADGWALQGDAPSLRSLPMLYCNALNQALFAGPPGTVDRLKHRRGRPSLTRHPSAAFHLQVLVKMKTRILRPFLNHRACGQRGHLTSPSTASSNASEQWCLPLLS